MANARLLHRAILLSVLNELLDDPAENELALQEPILPRSSEQVLGLGQERQLVEAFTFLASFTEDPRNVIAVALEPKSAGGLTVRVAANHGNLQPVQAGLQELANILERVSRDGQSNDKTTSVCPHPSGRPDSLPTSGAAEPFFLKLVSLHQNRILIKLGSRHAILKCKDPDRERLRPKPIPQLYSAVQHLRAQARPSPRAAKAHALEVTIDSLYDLFCELEGLETIDARSQAGLTLVEKIVRGAHRTHGIQASRDVGVLVESLQNLEPDSARKILTTIAKLSRYWTISKFLLKTASQSSLFQIVDVVAIHHELQTTPATQPDAYINRRINRICNDGRFKRKLKKRHLQSKERMRAFVTQQASAKHPVHAEVQLLWHYETTACEIKPRVIGASKKACFLCNLFFRLHGGYITLATHGKLYTKWALPVSGTCKAHAANLNRIVQGMVEVVQLKLEGELESPQRPRPPPAESVIFPSAACSYTNRSDSVVDFGDVGKMPSNSGGLRSAEVLLPITRSGDYPGDAASTNEMVPTSVTRSPIAASYGPGIETCNNTSHASAKANSVSDSSSRGDHVESTSETSSIASAASSFSEDHQLELGVPVWRQMSASTPEVSVSTPHLHINLSYDQGEAQAQTLCEAGRPEWPADYWVEMLWCTQDVLEVPENVGVTNVESMSHGAATDVRFRGDEPRVLRLCYKGDTVTLTYHRGPTPGPVR